MIYNTCHRLQFTLWIFTVNVYDPKKYDLFGPRCKFMHDLLVKYVIKKYCLLYLFLLFFNYFWNIVDLMFTVI